MHADVTELRDFYATPLGQVVRRLLMPRLRARWTSVKGETIVGLGFATPYLGSFRRDGARVVALMPAAQGAIVWPREGGVLSVLVVFGPEARAESFASWLEDVWPEAKAAGVSRATFDKNVKGLTPDLSLPDLDLPGRGQKSDAGQAEFTKAPQDYLNRSYLMRLAETGRKLAAKHAAELGRIEREIGVDRYSLLAIWGRETAYGAAKDKLDAIRALATQAYTGRRKELFRSEFVLALKMIESGVPRQKMKSSWAGAMGLTQFLPSEYFLYATDFDGDRHIDIFGSVPDALASAARQLAGKGWVARQTWGYEVRVPEGSDCSLEGPTQERPLGEWAKLGFVRAGGKPWTPEQLALNAYLMSPAGGYGPTFLVLENFKVIRRYNTSDLYAVFVGHLADRISGAGDFEAAWGGVGPQRTHVVEEIQQRLQKLGGEAEKIDGKIGSNTRKVIGKYQRSNRLKVDCWPSEALLTHLRSVAQR